ncbi:unnamed protein product [Mycena citricolor]|uniref:Uncharacterized protein n=1 Tax=Mycena citricolor TaxID=2018698 RepID=A0AAD2HAK9_9AGAR|nr:unnamed protein product [Mycena citricolor]
MGGVTKLIHEAVPALGKLLGPIIIRQQELWRRSRKGSMVRLRHVMRPI